MRDVNKEKVDGMRKKWLYIPNPQPVVKNRVFCFHYAAVSAEVYHNWGSLFEEGTEVCCVQLPGRSTRSDEPRITVMDDLVASIADVILSCDDVPYVLFGHCMGGYMAYEVARCIIRRKGNLPCAIFVSGENPPHFPYRRDLHTFSDGELLQALKSINYTPEDFCFTEETISEMLPIIKSDFQLVDDWHFNPEDSQLPIPLYVYGGRDDEFVTEENIKGWNLYTSKGFKYRMLAGNHFFIKDEKVRDEIIRDMKDFLKVQMNSDEKNRQ